jgi:bacillopeptidase F
VGEVYQLWDFEPSANGFIADGAGDWAWSLCRGTGPNWGHSLQFAWATVPQGSYHDDTTSTLTKTFTLPTGDNGLYLQWWEWYETEKDDDEGFVYVNGELKHYVTGVSDGWQHVSLNVGDLAGQQVTVNWVFETDESVNYAGWYLDDVAIHGGCPPRPKLVATAHTLQTALCPGATGILTNALCNAGTAPLVWSLTEEPRATTTDEGLADVPWLSADPTAGTIQFPDCTQIDVTFAPWVMAAGDYYADLVLSTNDPRSPTVTWPVSMTVKTQAECGPGKTRVYLPVVLKND